MTTIASWIIFLGFCSGFAAVFAILFLGDE